MVMKLDQLVNGAINVGFGAAAVAVEGSKKVLDDLSTKGEQVRKDAGTPISPAVCPTCSSRPVAPSPT